MRVQELKRGGWHHLVADGDTPYEITGKYLFFSPSADRLLDIGRREIIEHGFHEAKVSTVPSVAGGDYVLCLYYKDQSRRTELRDRAKEYGVQYRWWKSNADTAASHYSEQFLKALSPEEKKRRSETAN
jgi:hypothetical protein